MLEKDYRRLIVKVTIQLLLTSLSSTVGLPYIPQLFYPFSVQTLEYTGGLTRVATNGDSTSENTIYFIKDLWFKVPHSLSSLSGSFMEHPNHIIQDSNTQA